MNSPNDSFEDKDGRDPLLEALFSREHTHVAAEPFTSETLRAIADERTRARRRPRVLLAAAMLAFIVLSPQLIAGSTWLSSRLDELFALASSWLATPLGMGAGALAAAAVAAARRFRVF